MNIITKLLASRYSSVNAGTATIATNTVDHADIITVTNKIYTVTSDSAVKYISLPEVPVVGNRVVLIASATDASNLGYRLESGNDNVIRAANDINGLKGATYYIDIPGSSIVIAEAVTTTSWVVTIMAKQASATHEAVLQSVTATIAGDGTGIITNGTIIDITTADDAHIVTLPAASIGRTLYLEIPTGVKDAVVTCAGADTMGCGGVFTKLTMGQLTTAYLWCTEIGQWNVIYSNDATPLS